MDDVARRAARDRYDLFLMASRELGYNSAIVEKDFWVCWLLKRLFSLPGFEGAFVFKGGTSLSKVYGAIERFSEDVDLVWNRESLGFRGDKDPSNVSQNKAEKELIPELIATAKATLNDRLVPALTAWVEEHLGDSSGWTIAVEDDDIQPSVLFRYPGVSGIRSGYVTPHVLLELVPRSEPEPSGEAIITPYLAQAVAVAFKDPDVRVRHLHAARTFWEKVTILHMYHHYPEGKPFGPRFSRHYYDTFQLFVRGHADAALANLDLLRAVVRHKKRFYRSGPAKFDQAAEGLLRLVPPPARMEALQADYLAMSEMFFGKPPDFDEIIATLHAIEDRVNAMTAPVVD